MSSFSSQRGAVHILFLIFVLVVTLAFGALWFVQLQENERLQLAATSANLEVSNLRKEVIFQKDYYEELARKIGPLVGGTMPTGATGTGRDAADPYIKGIENRLNEIGPGIDDPSVRPLTIEEGLRPAIDAYQRLKTAIATKDVEIDRLKNEKAALENQIRGIQDTHTSTVTTLNQEHDQSRRTSTATIDELRRTNESFSTQVRETQDELEAAREKARKEKEALTDAKETLDSNVRALKNEARLSREKEAPDGKVLGVNEVNGTVYLDFGSETQLRRGTRFRVFGLERGERFPKGYITVVDVAPNRSEARVEAGRGNRAIEAGDLVFNPVFDKDHATRFVFIGAPTGRYPLEVASQILRDSGAAVDSQVTVKTDFVVIGAKEHEDAEEIESREDYRRALQWGVEMIRDRDLEVFLQR